MAPSNTARTGKAGLFCLLALVGSVAACSSPETTTLSGADGPHTFLRAEDAADSGAPDPTDDPVEAPFANAPTPNPVDAAALTPLAADGGF